MSLQVFNTSDTSKMYHDTLIYSFHGWGKTTQFLNYQREFGKGFLISGEAGLRSIQSAGIDYLPFNSWDGEVDQATGNISFMAIIRFVASQEFKDAGYTWIGLDSLTELSDRLQEHLAADPKIANSNNAFELWKQYGEKMIGSLKWLRDLPYHTLVTALAKESKNNDGDVEYWPSVKGNAVSQQIPGIFDNVFCGVRVSSGSKDNPTIKRYVVTDEVKGWKGKCRDENRRLKPVMAENDVTKLFRLMDMTDEEFAQQKEQQKQAAKAAAQ